MKFLVLSGLVLMIAGPAFAVTRVDTGPQSEAWRALHRDVNSGKDFTQGQLPPVSIDEPATPAVVPEPASWALMVGGFGLVGGALRRRNMARVAA